MTRPIRITVGTSRLSRRLTRKKVRWESLADRLQRYATIDKTFEEYLALPVDEQADLKDVGFMVGGQFKGPKRLQADMARRSVITLDIDHIDSWDLEAIEDAYGDYEYVVHSTAKHCEETPRLRLVLPLDKDIAPDKYEPVARMVASWLNLDCFDDTTFQPARIMYWPSVTIDGEIYKHRNHGTFLNAQEILDEYEDWTDFGEWPHSSRIDRLRKPTQAAEDPLQKPGIIGAFNRQFDIHAAIREFDLPYEATEFENRYAPEGSSGAAGAIVYDDVFLYSHHESDVAAQQNLNAFDLVRLHKYADLAAGETQDSPMGERASFRAMSQLAVSYDQVAQELHTSPDEMEALPDDPPKKNGVDHDPSEASLTFKDLRMEMLSVDKADDPERACDQMIPKIAAAKLAKSDTSRLAGLLRELYPAPKPTKKSIEDSIKDAGKRLTGQLASDGTLMDMERMVIQRVLDEHFQEGRTIRRVGKKFWTYKEGYWSITPDEVIHGRLLSTIIKLREERPDDDLELVAIIEEGKTSAWLRSLSNMFAAMLAEREDVEDPLGLMRRYPLPVINCRNCELWFDETGDYKRVESEPEHFFTHRVDVKYKPKEKCPEWMRFNEMIWSESSDPIAMQRHLEELMGYVLGTSRWLKTWVLFHGSKDTGKSTVADVLRAMLGNAYLAKEFTVTFGGGRSQFAESSLIGRLAVVDDDYDKNQVLPDGFIKRISEEKTFTAEIKWGDELQFAARTLPIILSNHWPVTRDVTDAFRERALVFPFTHRIIGAEQDDLRRVRMMEEMPGMLNRFVAGLKRLRRRGTWNVPLDCAEAARAWAVKSNPAAQFIEDTLVPAPGARLHTVEVWNAYKRWIKDSSAAGNVRGIGRNEFYDRLDSLLGARITGAGRSYFWEGYRIIDSRTEEMDDAGVDDWDD